MKPVTIERLWWLKRFRGWIQQNRHEGIEARRHEVVIEAKRDEVRRNIPTCSLVAWSPLRAFVPFRSLQSHALCQTAWNSVGEILGDEFFGLLVAIPGIGV